MCAENLRKLAIFAITAVFSSTAATERHTTGLFYVSICNEGILKINNGYNVFVCVCMCACVCVTCVC